MAIAFGQLIHGAYNNADQNSYAFTVTNSPTAGRVIFMSVGNLKATTPDTPSVSGLNLTWNQIDTGTETTQANKSRFTTYWANVVSPSGTTITVSFAGVTQLGCSIIAMEFDGVDGSIGFAGTNHSIASFASTTTPTGTLPSAPTSGGVWAAVCQAANQTVSPEAGWTEPAGADVAGTSPSHGQESAYILSNDQTYSPTFNSSAQVGIIAIVEIAAAGATTPPDPRQPKAPIVYQVAQQWVGLPRIPLVQLDVPAPPPLPRPPPPGPHQLTQRWVGALEVPVYVQDVPPPPPFLRPPPPLPYAVVQRWVANVDLFAGVMDFTPVAPTFVPPRPFQPAPHALTGRLVQLPDLPVYVLVVPPPPPFRRPFQPLPYEVSLRGYQHAVRRILPTILNIPISLTKIQWDIDAPEFRWLVDNLEELTRWDIDAPEYRTVWSLGPAELRWKMGQPEQENE